MGRRMPTDKIDDSVRMILSYRKCAIIVSWANYVSKLRKMPPFDREEENLRSALRSSMSRMRKKVTSSSP